MSSIANISGLASGLDTNEIIEKMLSYKQRPVNLLNSQKSELTEKLAAWQSINARLLAVKMKAAELSNLSSFDSSSVTSSKPEALAATATGQAAPGSYTLRVVRTATAHQVASAASYGSTTSDGVGTGTITISNESAGTSTVINIAAGADSLEAVRDAINRSQAGAVASIVSDGSDQPYRLLVASRSTGTAGELQITTNLSSGLGLSFDGAGSVISEASDARVELGSSGTPVVITSSSNVISDAIPGVTLNLLEADEDTSITLTVGRNTKGTVDRVSSFVEAYNSFVEYLGTVDSYDSETKESGALLGDYSLQTIQADLASIVNRSVTGLSGSMKALTDLGISLTGDGTLALDQSRLTAALNEDPDAAARVFARSGRATDAGITFVNATGRTAETSGSGSIVEITRLATRTRVTTGVAMGDTLATAETVTLNGVKIQLKADLTLDDVLRTINAQSASSGVTVTATGAGGEGSGRYLTFTQTNYGSAPSVSVSSDRSATAAGSSGIGTVAATGLAAGGETGFGTGAQGVDVAGSINGEAGIGAGKTLTGASGNRTTDGLSVLVNSTTTGTKGYVSYSRGAAAGMNDLLSSLTDVTSGTIATKQQGLQTQMDALDTQMNSLIDRLATEEERIRAQFAAMESALATIQNQSQYLSAQISGLAGWSNNG